MLHIDLATDLLVQFATVQPMRVLAVAQPYVFYRLGDD
jgi:hypothetical protein